MGPIRIFLWIETPDIDATAVRGIGARSDVAYALADAISWSSLAIQLAS